MIHDKLKCFGVYVTDIAEATEIQEWAIKNGLKVKIGLGDYFGTDGHGKYGWMGEDECSDNIITMETFRELAGLSQSRTTAPDILKQANSEMGDRAKTYDAPAGERSMAKTVAAFNAIFGKDLTEVEGWQLMAILKIVRSSQGDFRLDNFVDGAAYMGLAGEAASGAEDGGGE